LETIGDMDSHIIENIKHDFIKNYILLKNIYVDLKIYQKNLEEKRIQNLRRKMEIKILLII